MSYINKILTSALVSLMTATAMAAPSILDIRHSITDDNIIPPESFETQTRELEENFYLKHYTEQAADNSRRHTGNDKEYEQLLSRLPAEIEMPFNPVVGKYIEMYLDRKRQLVADMLALHNYYGPIFIEELLKEGVPLELQYLPVIESAINPNAVSRAGACGLWQFMPATAIGLGMEVNSLVDERRDPRVSSRNAAKYLKQLYSIYGDWSLAIAAYNCGPGNVNKALRRAGGGKQDFWEIYNYLPKETRGYVPAFIAANYVMNYHNKYGINPTVVKHRLVTDTIQVGERIHFNQIANVINVPIEEIRMLNPQFRKDIIPGDNHPYALVLPQQKCYSYLVSEDAIRNFDSDQYARRTYVEPGRPREDRPDANALAAGSQTQNAAGNTAIASDVEGSIVEQTHVVTRGESLRDIAKQYGVSSTDIKRWNNLRRGKVKEGDQLVIKTVRRELAGASTAPTGKSTVTEQRGTAAPVASATRPQSSKKTAADRKKNTKPKTTTYTVKSGDSLEKIARRHGTTVDALRKANGMSKNSSHIDVGQKIKVPSASSSKKSGGKKSSKKKRRRR